MNCKIPFTKDIDFGKKVSEITSISLEHDLAPEEGSLKGNFIVSGDFKSHEVSVNKEAFSYILPFEIDLTEDIDVTTIEFMIEDFNYEIVDESKLRVKIEFQVLASKKEIKEEPLFQEPEKAFVEETRAETTEEPKTASEETKEENNKEKIEERQIDKTKEEQVKEITKEDEDTIINNIKVDSEEYTTYHIHMVSDGETVETICTMYNSNINILGEYNDLSNITVGDKIVIPEINE